MFACMSTPQHRPAVPVLFSCTTQSYTRPAVLLRYTPHTPKLHQNRPAVLLYHTPESCIKTNLLYCHPKLHQTCCIVALHNPHPKNPKAASNKTCCVAELPTTKLHQTRPAVLLSRVPQSCIKTDLLFCCTEGSWGSQRAASHCSRGSQTDAGQCMPAGQHGCHGHLLHHSQAAGAEVPPHVCGCLGIHHSGSVHGGCSLHLCGPNRLAVAPNHAGAASLLGGCLLCDWLLRGHMGYTVPSSISGTQQADWTQQRAV